MKAQQEAEAAKYIFQKEVTLANATRMKKIIEAKGEAEAKLIRAEAERQSLLKILSVFGNRTEHLLQYEFIKALSEFKGTLILYICPANRTGAMPVIFYPAR